MTQLTRIQRIEAHREALYNQMLESWEEIKSQMEDKQADGKQLSLFQQVLLTKARFFIIKNEQLLDL